MIAAAGCGSSTDPNEFTNLAGKPEFADRIQELVNWRRQNTAEEPYGEGYRPF
jgi:hypothetical protein